MYVDYNIKYYGLKDNRPPPIFITSTRYNDYILSYQNILRSNVCMRRAKRGAKPLGERETEGRGPSKAEGRAPKG